MTDKKTISVIISTYNSIPWLEKTLWSYEQQVFRQFEIIIADDGSDKETADFIKNYKSNSSKDITHVWHEDNGFQKSSILNKAILACNTDYIVMSDGDCIAREDFLQIHYERRNLDIFFLVDIINCHLNFLKKSQEMISLHNVVLI